MSRVSIDRTNNEVVLTFNHNFYSRELIHNAIADFRNICEPHFEEDKLILKPKSSDVRLDILGYEFYNYVLGLMKSR